MKKEKIKRDLRSPLAKARDEYFSTDKGKLLCAGTATGQYLLNRLERAFIDGWGHCEKYFKEREEQNDRDTK